MSDTDRTVYGLKPVLEALRSPSSGVRCLYFVHGLEGALPEKLRGLAERAKIPQRSISRREMTERCGTDHHQGVMASVAAGPRAEFEELLRPSPTDVLLVADGVQDPRNLGSLMRCTEFAGGLAVLVPKHGGAGLTAAVSKTSAGASEHLPLLTVTNLSQALASLKEAGYWCYGAVAEGGVSLFQARFHGPAVIVVGSEEKGIRPLVARGCDVLVTIPRFGRVESLNVANAASVMLMEFRRQQDQQREEG